MSGQLVSKAIGYLEEGSAMSSHVMRISLSQLDANQRYALLLGSEGIAIAEREGYYDILFDLDTEFVRRLCMNGLRAHEERSARTL